jgi:hypothetical protein
MPAARAISGTASGHPRIRATHRKTLELSREREITERATCVVGVAAEIDEHALAALHGHVELTLSAGERAETVRGRLNPAFRPGDPLVVRRASAVTRDALVIGADRAACDLPRSFVEELARPSARIAVRIELSAAAAGPGVLVVHPLAPEELGRIDTDIRGKNDPEEVAGALEDGRQVALVADLAEDAAARAAIHAAHDAGHTVLPAPGVSLVAAVQAVGGLGPGAELVEGVPAERLQRRLDQAAGVRGAVVLDPGTPREQYLPWRSGDKLEIPGARGRTAAFAVEPAAAGDTARAEAMAAAGASTRDVARALQDDAGLPHRRAYELALDLTADTSSVSRPEPRTSR